MDWHIFRIENKQDSVTCCWRKKGGSEGGRGGINKHGNFMISLKSWAFTAAVEREQREVYELEVNNLYKTLYNHLTKLKLDL